MEDSTAAEVRRRVLGSGDRFWHVAQFHGPAHAVALELRRLVQAGELERVRRGTYWRGRKSRFGRTAPAAIQALRRVVARSEAVGAAGWYATNLLGLSTQVSPVPVVSVTARPPEGLHGVRLIDRSARRGRRDARLNVTEVTILEALDGWDRYVELDRRAAMKRFIQLLGTPEVRIDRLVRASSTESPRVRERLRAVLSAGGWADEAGEVQAARSRSSREGALRVVEGVPG